VSTRRADALWKWLITKNFIERWRPEGVEYHDGFVGEYPWATPFNMYKDSFDSSFGEDDAPLPCRVIPTSVSLYTSSDSYQADGVKFRLPARRFFEGDDLRWNGVSGYTSPSGLLCFLDPSVCDPGPGALLVNSDHLRQYLAANGLALVWTVVGEKLRIGDNSDPRLTYNRAHMIKGLEFRTSKPLVVID
jgi:hypothetical protein